MPAPVASTPSAAAAVNQPARSPAASSAPSGGSSSAASQSSNQRSAPPGADKIGTAAAPSLMDEAFAGLDRLGRTGSSIKPPEHSKPGTPNSGMDEDQEQSQTQSDEKAQDTEEKGTSPEQTKTQEQGKPKEKVSPWKLVDHYKSTNTTLQKEIAELRSKQAEPPKEWQDKFAAAQKRAEELENHIRFVDYQKSAEFQDKYSKPYEEAWMRAISGLKGLKVQWTDPNTSELVGRDITPQDIAALANMDPAAARQEIRQRFPDVNDAAEVKGYVERIRDLAYAQNKALEEYQSKGAEHWKAQAEQMQAKQRAFIESNTKLWETINKEAVEKFDFLRPVEGDETRNAKLEGAIKFVDEALASRITDPRLSDEDRALVLRKHAALRNRAIGYSVLLHENKALKAKMAELEQSLKAYEGSEPSAGDGKGKDTSSELNGEALMDSVLSGMNKYVRK